MESARSWNIKKVLRSSCTYDANEYSIPRNSVHVGGDLRTIFRVGSVKILTAVYSSNRYEVSSIDRSFANTMKDHLSVLFSGACGVAQSDSSCS